MSEDGEAFLAKVPQRFYVEELQNDSICSPTRWEALSVRSTSISRKIECISSVAGACMTENTFSVVYDRTTKQKGLIRPCAPEDG